MNKLFDILNPRIFTVFARNDREANYDLLAFIYGLFTKGERKQTIDRDELSDNLADYIQSRDFGVFEDEEGQSINNKSSKDKATMKLRQFKKTGWLEEDNSEDQQFKTVYTLNDNALQLLQTFHSITTKENKPLEYSGYFYAVYSLLKDFDYSQSKGILEQVERNTEELFNSLQGLSSTIKRFIEEIINRPDITPNDVLDTLLYQYQDQVVLTVFNNLKGRDNPSKYTSVIVKKLKELRYTDFEKVLDGYALQSGRLTNEQYTEAKENILSLLDDCIAKYSSVDAFVALIDHRNSKFHSSSLSKLKFLINTRRDVNGLLDNALKALRQTDPCSDYEEIIRLESCMQIDGKSLYSRSFDKEKVTYSKTVIPSASKEEIEKEAARIFQEDQFSKKKIDEFAMSILETQNEIASENIHLKNEDSLMVLLMLQLYSQYTDMSYEIRFLPDFYEINGYSIQKFILVRKDKNHE